MEIKNADIKIDSLSVFARQTASRFFFFRKILNPERPRSKIDLKNLAVGLDRIRIRERNHRNWIQKLVQSSRM